MLGVCFRHSLLGFIWDLGGGFYYSLLVLCWISLSLGHASVGLGGSGTCAGLNTYWLRGICFAVSLVKKASVSLSWGPLLLYSSVHQCCPGDGATGHGDDRKDRDKKRNTDAINFPNHLASFVLFLWIKTWVFFPDFKCLYYSCGSSATLWVQRASGQKW